MLRLEHKAWLESQGLDDKTLKKKCKRFQRIQHTRLHTRSHTTQVRRQDTRRTSGKKEEMRYSGERKLLGIGMMHKSQLLFPCGTRKGQKKYLPCVGTSSWQESEEENPRMDQRRLTDGDG